MDKSEYAAGCKTYHLKMVEFKTINESEVDAQKILFCNEDDRYNHFWGKLSFSWDHFFIAWRSETFGPVIKQVGESSTVIAVDENYAVFSKPTLTTITGTSSSSLLGVEVIDDIAVIAFEMEIHIYKAGMSTMLCKFGLPDIAENIQFTFSSIIVKCMGDFNTYTFDFPLVEQ
jgi:hypothetical protein